MNRPHTLYRIEMTSAEKARYIRENGKAAYLALPWSPPDGEAGTAPQQNPYAGRRFTVRNGVVEFSSDTR